MVIDGEGDVQLLELGDEISPTPIVLMNGQVLHPGGVDCDLWSDHPQCATLEALAAGEKQPNAPSVVWVRKGQGADLFINLQSGDYPPPVVVVDNEVVNR